MVRIRDERLTPAVSGRRRHVHHLPTLVSLAVALTVLGPALGRGVVIAYDMPWSPEARLTPFAMGVGTPAPRAVPSDAVAAVLGMALGSSLTQKLVLLAVLVLVGTGAAALLREVVPGAGALAGSASATTAIWCAFVAERLVVGQWTVLLGYAVLPWVIRAVIRSREPDGRFAPVVGWLAVAGLGGANTLVVAGLGAVGLCLPPVRWRAVVASVVAWAAFAAVWAVPALTAGGGAEGGAAEFRPRADGPWGPVGSLLTTGGFWNPASYPAGRESPVLSSAALLLALVSAAAAVAAARGRRSRPVVVTGVVGLLLAVVSVTPVLGDWWADAVVRLPGGGLLRDAQKFVAAWALLLSLGAGVLVMACRRVASRETAVVGGILLTLLPIALLPALAWGVGGRLVPTTVPDSYRDAVSELNRLDAALVGVLPWRQYRRYDWNGSRISLTLLPRMSRHQVLYDDSLPLASGSVPGEDARAARVSAAIAAGANPIRALEAEGVRYVAIERGSGLPEPEPPGGVTVVVDSPTLTVLDLGRGPRPDSAAAALQVGWALTLVAWATTAVAWPASALRRRKTGRREAVTGPAERD